MVFLAEDLKKKRLTRATKSRTSQTTINSDAELKADKKDPKGTRYRCSDCGEFFTDQKNFYRSMSPLYAGNNGYFPVCKSCVKKYYDYLIEYFSGNEEKALDRMCSVMDLYYSDALAVASKGANTSVSRIASYISKSQMKQFVDKGTTYLDTIKDRASTTINNLDDVEEVNESGEKVISPRVLKQWGFGYEPEEYSLLQEHYKMLTTQFTNADAVQDALIKDLCTIKVLQTRAMKKGDPDSFDKFTKLYHSTLKAGGLKTRSETDSIDDESACWGNFIKDVETLSPADIYLDKKMFDDVDKVKEYFERFILRPVINFFSGSRTQDSEFSVMPGEDDG